MFIMICEYTSEHKQYSCSPPFEILKYENRKKKNRRYAPNDAPDSIEAIKLKVDDSVVEASDSLVQTGGRMNKKDQPYAEDG